MLEKESSKTKLTLTASRLFQLQGYHLSFTMGNSEPLRLIAKQIPVLLK